MKYLFIAIAIAILMGAGWGISPYGIPEYGAEKYGIGQYGSGGEVSPVSVTKEDGTNATKEDGANWFKE